MNFSEKNAYQNQYKVIEGKKMAFIDAGEDMVLEKFFFVEAILPGSISKKMSEVEMDESRRPFTEFGESRLPILTWPREIPIAGAPHSIVEIVSEYADWLANTSLLKLFIKADPSALLPGPVREFVRTWSGLTEVRVAGLHFIQEDSPHEIGNAVSEWIEGLET